MDGVSRKYMSEFPNAISKIKLVILMTLLDEGVGFPRGWVEGSRIMYLTNLNNFDRHINELRDEYGCDIELQSSGGQKNFRLRSPDRLEIKPKATLEQTQKDALLIHANNACQVCGAQFIPGQNELNTDQKIPGDRGGGKDLTNWQVSCNDCIVNKRRACNQCKDICTECSWAFPERVDGVTLIRLPAELIQKLKNAGISQQSDIEKRIISSLERSLTENKPAEVTQSPNQPYGIK